MRLSRRLFLTLGVTAGAGLAAGAGLMRAASAQVVHYEYTPEILAEFAASGSPYIVNFWASWCTTCALQQRVIGELQAESQAYLNVPVIRVDWDRERQGELVARLAIPRRSTLVLMDGEEEISRLVAETRREAIEAMFTMAI
ncbi:thioredoxin family protein [Pelagibacterium montanilacus]|uniref:thioredoxin family protein n=1 Tax=Pelagibacterium montanilacus TaxID=2185280 RepID=UPI0019D2ED22|nr:thioredoxin family protein [Pelagibacterium montanilacus]